MTEALAPNGSADASGVLLWLTILALRSFALLLVAAGVAFALRRRSAALRHAVWTVAAGAVLLVPAVSAALPSLKVDLPPVVAGADDLGRRTRPAPGWLGLPTRREAVDVPDRGAVSNAGFPPPVAASATGEAALLLLLWATVASILMARLMLETVRLRRVSREARRVGGGRLADAAVAAAACTGLRPVPVLLIGGETTSPMTWGLRRACVLLPHGAAAWSHERLHSVLSHEFAHVARRDYLTQWLAQVVCALHWFNPLAWYAERCMRVERELACDDAVLAQGITAASYATALVDIARMIASRRPVAAAPSGAAGLRGRVSALLDPERNRSPLTRPAVMTAAGVGLVLLLAAGILYPVAVRPSVHVPAGTASTSLLSDHRTAVTLTSRLDEGVLTFGEIDRLFAMVAAEMESDHHAARVLLAVIERSSLQAPLPPSFLQATETLESDHHHATVLATALETATFSDDDLARISEQIARNISSEHHAARVNRALAENRASSAVTVDKLAPASNRSRAGFPAR